MATCRILGLDIAVLTRDVAAQVLAQRIHERNPVRVAFVNANLANLAYRDAPLRKSLQDFLLLNDGAGLNLARRVLHGGAFPDNLNGTDFTPYFLDRCREPLNVFMLGAAAPVVARAAQVFVERWPHHRLVGRRHGYFTDDDNRVFEAIRQAAPDLVLVAMGNGLQERVVARLVPEIAPSAWGVGGLFDFLSGNVPRAPSWMRRRGLEWTYRLWQEPRRLGPRYFLGNPAFVVRVLRERISPTDR